MFPPAPSTQSTLAESSIAGTTRQTSLTVLQFGSIFILMLEVNLAFSWVYFITAKQNRESYEVSQKTRHTLSFKHFPLDIFENFVLIKVLNDIFLPLS